MEGEDDTYVSSWSGCYVKSSDLCTTPGNGESCAETFRDELVVEADADVYLVSLYSTQADQHVCSFSLKMHAIDNALVYPSQFGRIEINSSSGFLEISSKGVDPTALGLGVCGAHADIDGLRFPFASFTNECSRK
jgi:hypothetical protein